jgi:hypothetical protein
MPKVSVIILNYNGKGLIVNCLHSLGRQRFRDFEVIVVDNGSSDGSILEINEFLKNSRIISNTKLILLDKNLGFTGGNIEGLKYCSGKYIVLLNNDTVVDENWLFELVRAVEAQPDIGICASKLITYGTNVIDSAGDGYAASLKGFKRGEGEDSKRFSQQEYVFGACGGAVLYRREMLDEIGFLDEDFFLIHEDTDLNFRAQLAGWKVLYVPAAVVYHKVRSSIGHMSDKAIYYTLRNSELVRIKNIPISLFLNCMPVFILGIVSEFLYFAIKHRRLGLYFKAKIDALKMLPRMLKKRKAIMKNKKVSNAYLISIMTPLWQRDFLKNKVKKFISC